jgi:hypothetical protein
VRSVGQIEYKSYGCGRVPPAGVDYDIAVVRRGHSQVLAKITNLLHLKRCMHIVGKSVSDTTKRFALCELSLGQKTQCIRRRRACAECAERSIEPINQTSTTFPVDEESK